MSVLTQSYQCGTWFVCSILRELAVSNLGQPLLCLSITWSRCRNAYRDLWIMTIALNQESHPPYRAMVMMVISLNEVHVWWKKWVLVFVQSSRVNFYFRMILIFIDHEYALGGGGICIIVTAAQTCPCCVKYQYYWLKSGILFVLVVHRGTGVSEITKYILFWCWHRYLGGRDWG